MGLGIALKERGGRKEWGVLRKQRHAGYSIYYTTVNSNSAGFWVGLAWRRASPSVLCTARQSASGVRWRCCARRGDQTRVCTARAASCGQCAWGADARTRLTRAAVPVPIRRGGKRPVASRPAAEREDGRRAGLIVRSPFDDVQPRRLLSVTPSALLACPPSAARHESPARRRPAVARHAAPARRDSRAAPAPRGCRGRGQEGQRRNRRADQEGEGNRTQEAEACQAAFVRRVLLSPAPIPVP
jgi:hypothetical protein